MYLQEFFNIYVLKVVVEFQVMWPEPAPGSDPVELDVGIVLQHILGLVHPVAIERGRVLALLVVPGVLEHVVESERGLVGIDRVSLIVKAQYVDLVVSLIRRVLQCSGSRTPAQAGSEELHVIAYLGVLVVLVIVVAPYLVCDAVV